MHPNIDGIRMYHLFFLPQFHMYQLWGLDQQSYLAIDGCFKTLEPFFF